MFSLNALSGRAYSVFWYLTSVYMTPILYYFYLIKINVRFRWICENTYSVFDYTR